jgi:hypothetical protein
VFDQAMAINAFDSNGYMLKVNLFVSECSDYQNVQSLKKKLQEDPGFYARCAAILGPNQPGITQRDPSYTGAQNVAEHTSSAAKSKKKTQARRKPDVPKAPTVDKDTPKKKIDEARRKAEKLKEQLEDTLGIQLPDLPQTPSGLPQLPALPDSSSSADAQGLLDFLLGP